MIVRLTVHNDREPNYYHCDSFECFEKHGPKNKGKYLALINGKKKHIGAPFWVTVMTDQGMELEKLEYK